MNIFYQLCKKSFRVKVSLDGIGVENQERASIYGSEGKREREQEPFQALASPKGNTKDDGAANENNRRNMSLTHFTVLSSITSEDSTEESKASVLDFLSCQGIQRHSFCNKQRIIRLREPDATSTLW